MVEVVFLLQYGNLPQRSQEARFPSVLSVVQNEYQLLGFGPGKLLIRFFQSG